MADSTIDGLPAATAITGSELLIVNQSGTDKKATASAIVTALASTTSGAPSDASYIVATASTGLTAERVATSSTSIIADTVTNSSQIRYKRAAITGDVTISEDSNSSVVAPNAVSNAKAADMAANTVKVNNTSATGDPADLALSTNQLLGRGAGDIVGLTLGANLSITGTTLDASAASGAPTDATYIVATSNGSLSAERVATSSSSITFNVGATGQISAERAALTGVVTAAANSNVTTIAADQVTNVMLENMTANSVKGNATSGAADPANIAIGTNQILGRGTGNVTPLTVGTGLSINSSTNTITANGQSGFIYNYTSAAITDTDPGTGLVRFNHASVFGSITKMFISDTTANGMVIGDYVDLWKVGSTTILVPSGSSTTTFCLFTVVGVATATGYKTVTLTPIVGGMPVLGVSYEVTNYPGVNLADLLAQDIVRTNATGDLINSDGNIIPVSGETMASLLAAGMVRTNSIGQFIDGSNAVISTTSAVADYAAMEALDAATYDNFAVIPQTGTFGSVWVSNGSRFNPLNGQYIQDNTNTSIRKVICANNVTWTASSNGAATPLVRLTASAVHGLTTTPAVGASLYLTNTPANWTAASFHQIGTVVNTTVIDLTTPWVTGLGTAPTFALINTNIPIKSSSVPPLRPNSRCILEFGVGNSADAGGSQRRTVVDLNATNITTNNLTSTTTVFVPFRVGFKNLGVTNSQRGLAGLNSTGLISNTLDPATAAVDTTLTTNTITISFLIAAINLTMELQDFTMIIRS